MTSLEQSLIADIPRLTADEQSALRYVVDRILVQGRAGYAPWQAEGDKRDMEKEIADECADAIVYTGMRAVMRARRKQERLRCFIHDDAFARVSKAAESFPDDSACTDCLGVGTHRVGCPWIVVVPGAEVTP
jgi:hypothetical protein